METTMPEPLSPALVAVKAHVREGHAVQGYHAERMKDINPEEKGERPPTQLQPVPEKKPGADNQVSTDSF
jgi:hypothetical protein